MAQKFPSHDADRSKQPTANPPSRPDPRRDAMAVEQCIKAPRARQGRSPAGRLGRLSWQCAVAKRMPPAIPEAMMEATPPKLSLVAQFDCLCRKLRDDTQGEELFLDFVPNQEACRQHWHAAELEKAELRRQVAALQEANTELSRNLAHIK
ncbi:hypothetical protein HPB48_012567 [Haemaphysalis longicornis]|uniref:Uncharacterized protein n=1 Tax=Haemaphysalis longicornis TaxID=44386 RepID=A0A9J6GMZ1_HAELO|nr:hypothetical protein HPB48_012567 [Haemaphysalis longicornis]